MDPASLVLALLGIIISVILSDPVIRLGRNLMSRLNRFLWSAKRYRRGDLMNKKHYGYENWSVHFSVSEDGSTQQTFDVRIINLSDKLLDRLFVPFFSDGGGLTAENMAPWAKSGRSPLVVEFNTVDEKRAQGRLAILHDPPLLPGERRRLRWGFNLPRVFAPGDDYFMWDVEVPYYDMTGHLEFDPAWRVLYAKWKHPNSGHLPAPVIDEHNIRWEVKLPTPGTRLHLILGLARAGT